MPPALQAACLKACEVGAQMRLLYTAELFREYVQKDLEKEVAALVD